MSCWQNIQLCCGACRICLYMVYQRFCCKKGPAPRVEYSVVCIGLTKAGKTTLLSVLCNENIDNITPTTDVDSCPLSNMMTSILQDNVVSCILCSTYTSAVDRRLQVEIACNRRIIWFQRGFVIKPYQFKDCMLQIKEIGGGEKQREFWRHYYRDAHAVVFVIDSACSDYEMMLTRDVLHDALTDPNLTNLPCLLLANCQDKIGARTEQQMSEWLDLPSLCAVRPCELILCSTIDDTKHIHSCFQSFIDRHLLSHNIHSRSIQ